MIEGQVRFCPRCGTSLNLQYHSGQLRPTCPHCDWVYFPDPKVAVAVVIQQNDQILLVQRLFDPQKGHWTLPSGYVDAGEDPIEAARRECQEETGFLVGHVQLLDVLFSQEHQRGASILIIYRAEIESGDLKAGDDAQAAAFFYLHELPPLAFASTRQILAQYANS